MLSQLATAEVGNAMLGNIVIVSGSFSILLALLRHFAWGPISDILKKCENKIANNLGPTGQSRINSAKIEQEREQQLLTFRSGAAGIIKNAEESGELSHQSVSKDAQKEVACLKSKARADTTIERDSTSNSVEDSIAELPLQITEEVLNKGLSSEMHESLINQYIESLGSSNETK